MINPFHQHSWEDVSTNYISPIETAESDLDRYGYTRLYQRCNRCGEYQETVRAGHLVIRDVPETVDMPMRIHRLDDEVLDNR